MYDLIKINNKYYLKYKRNEKRDLITNKLLFKIFIYIFKINNKNYEFLKYFENICFHKIEDLLFVDDILLKKLYNILTNYYLNKDLTERKNFEIFNEKFEIIYIPFSKDKEALENLVLLLNKLKININKIK